MNSIWVVGTRRLLGLSDSQSLPDYEQMPSNVRVLLRPGTDVFGDFEFCPFAPDRPGHMRMGCVQAGHRLRTVSVR